MSISLKKGEKISLRKENESLNKIIVGLGWDAIKVNESFLAKLFGGSTHNVDCDTSVLLLKKDKLTSNEDIVSFRKLVHKSKSVIHKGDNLTGDGKGDDEQILIDLNKVPDEYNKVVIVTNIYNALDRKQHFGMIKNAFIRVVNEENDKEICRYNLTDDYSENTAMIFGEIYRYNGEWKFNAIGEGTKDLNIDSLSKKFK